ncbi:MAG: hypothetical protein J0I90_06395, partial [Nitrosospira sp.]|nr:hypothetical protein [Nitrosospira sp.]
WSPETIRRHRGSLKYRQRSYFFMSSTFFMPLEVVTVHQVRISFSGEQPVRRKIELQPKLE